MHQLTNCPICNSKSIQFDYAAPTSQARIDQRIWSVWSCSECTHGFINPQPSWDELKSYYSDDYVAYNPMHGAAVENDEHAIESAKREGKIRHIPVPSGKKLLDVGCGAGFFIRIAEKLGATVKGVEPSSHGAKQARDNGLDVFNGTLEEYVATGTTDRFDIITSSHVIEHVPDPVRTLSVMKQLLSPGGYIWIAVPNANYPLARKLCGYWHSTELPWHLMQFSPKSIALAGERAGLKVKSQRTESIPRIVAGSLRHYLRKSWFLPRRLTAKFGFIDKTWAPKYAEQMDRECNGEAILTEFELPN